MVYKGHRLFRPHRAARLSGGAGHPRMDVAVVVVVAAHAAEIPSPLPPADPLIAARRSNASKHAHTHLPSNSIKNRSRATSAPSRHADLCRAITPGDYPQAPIDQR
ncbi:hypothetical protein VDGL01_03032 [Verticillium dahliae]